MICIRRSDDKRGFISTATEQRGFISTATEQRAFISTSPELATVAAWRPGAPLAGQQPGATSGGPIYVMSERTVRSDHEAHSELLRELGVRRRCYSRWIQDGKLTKVEATDRLERLERALDIVERAILLADMGESTAALASAALASAPAPAPALKIVRVSGLVPTTPLLLRGAEETEEAWQRRVDVAQRRLEAGLAMESTSKH